MLCKNYPAQPFNKIIMALNLSSVLKRLTDRKSKRQRTARLDEENTYIAPIQEDTVPAVRQPPVPASVTKICQNSDQDSVVKCILSKLDQGAAFHEFLSVAIPTGEDLDTPHINSEFDNLDTETENLLNDKLQNTNPHFLSGDAAEETCPERPKSPGHEYDDQFIPAEYGVRKPRFRAEVHTRMFKQHGGLSRHKLQTWSKTAQVLEKQLIKDYKANTDIKGIRKAMKDKLQQKRRRK